MKQCRWNSKTFMVILLMVCTTLIGLCFLFPKGVEQLVEKVLMLPIMAPLFYGLVVPRSMIAGGGMPLFVIMFCCFAPAFVMRRYIPEESKGLTKCWLLICFLMGVTYVSEFAWPVAFYLSVMPALAGLAIGKLVRYWI